VWRPPAGPDQHRPAAGAVPRRRAGAHGPPWHLPRPSTPCLAPHHSQRGAGPGSSPRSRPPTSGDAGYRQFSSSRTVPADPATGIPPGSGRRPRRSPAGDHSTGAPAADAQAATAPAAPTLHRSGHAASAGPHPRRKSKRKQPPRSTGHALAHLEDALAGVDLTLDDAEAARLEAPYRPHRILGHS
jgi:hypothetical protein